MVEAFLDLSSALRLRISALHRRAERSGVIADMIMGRVSHRAYTLFLRNLLPAYQAMERGLEGHRLTPGVREIAKPEAYRSNALEADLIALEGREWPEALPLLPAGARYAACVARAANGDGVGLIGHAYVRYLGDLSGGQILKRMLTNSLSIKPAALSFYDFPEIGDIGAYRDAFRDALNRSTWEEDRGRVIDAAVVAFEMNVSVSDEVCRAASPSASPIRA